MLKLRKMTMTIIIPISCMATAEMGHMQFYCCVYCLTVCTAWQNIQRAPLRVELELGKLNFVKRVFCSINVQCMYIIIYGVSAENFT